MSILLAFGIQAWWEERQERTSERSELARLFEEFVSNQERIENSLSDTSFPNRIIESAHRISTLLGVATQNNSEYAEIPNMDLANILQYPSLELETPVFDSLVRSGRFEILESPSVIRHIGNWEQLYRNALETQRDSRSFAIDHLFPAIAESGNIQHIVLNRYTTDRTVEVDPDGVTMIRADSKLTNIVAERYFWTSLAQHQWVRLESETEGVITEISRFLAQ